MFCFPMDFKYPLIQLVIHFSDVCFRNVVCRFSDLPFESKNEIDEKTNNRFVSQVFTLQTAH